MNINNHGANPLSSGGAAGGADPLARESSIYSLTFEEFQSAMGGLGNKGFGSMNMDELLRNIWSAEETQTIASSLGGQDGGGGSLQRQGSLTLPRTLSQKTVDEVWRDISKDYGTGNDVVVANHSAAAAAAVSNMPKRQQTLGEMTLEEFLVRAGVVREDIQPTGKLNNGGFFGELSHTSDNSAFAVAFQQPNRASNLMANSVPQNGNQIGVQRSDLPLSVNGVRSNQNQSHHPRHHQQQQIFPKHTTTGFAAAQMPMQSGGGQLRSPGIRRGIAGIGDQGINGGMIQGGGLGMAGLAGTVAGATGSPTNPSSSEDLGRSSGDTSSVSPVPYGFNGILRGRKCSIVEKVVERRQRRMIKNRESAARSRARKQAYTMELEAEVAKLKEENQKLRRKQAEALEWQKNQALEMMSIQQGGKRRCLRRTQTGPW